MNEILNAMNTAPDFQNTSEPAQGLRAINIHDFMAMTFPAREMMMGPVLPTQGLAMVYAPRGLGKTYFALSFAHAVASAGTFLNWRAPTPRRVLYIDGEMPGVLMQERIIQIDKGATGYLIPPKGLRIITPEAQKDVSPDISTRAGQALIDQHMDDADLLIIDNLASLHLSGAENEGDSWLQVQSWLLNLRCRGKSVLIVHHANKTGQQRGTSRREDILDTVIALRRPSDYTADQGARFEVHLEKARGIYGDDTLPFEAKLDTVDGAAKWTTKPLVDVEKMKVIELTKAGLTVREIADETSMCKSKVARLRREAASTGDLNMDET